MIDVIARAMAASASGGGASGGYTKAETDALLALKQDLITLTHKLSSDVVDFNITEEQIRRLHDMVETTEQTQTTVSGDNITITSDVQTEGDNIDLQSESSFVYKDEVYL